MSSTYTLFCRSFKFTKNKPNVEDNYKDSNKSVIAAAASTTTVTATTAAVNYYNSKMAIDQSTDSGPNNPNNAQNSLAAEEEDLKNHTEQKQEETFYYGINIPIESQIADPEDCVQVFEDKSEALKVVKKYKKARFKVFKTKEEALDFSLSTVEYVPINNNHLPFGSPTVGERPSLFKGPKIQDLIALRKSIEAGDINEVKKLIWDNPRYLVSSGDTPSILQEGARYNGLHVAAKSSHGAMCHLLLSTVSDPNFAYKLYGDEEGAASRASILTDLYLNTPDKARNETPLHMAVKFGAFEVVRVLVSYPQCAKDAVNKYGQTTKELICTRLTTPDTAVSLEIMRLLNDQYYVPVIRSDDCVVPPIIGEPFSSSKSNSPEILNRDPTAPVVEVRALAGPMDLEEAKSFRRKWKTPPRLLRSPLISSPHSPKTNNMFGLDDPLKGLERRGRELAQTCNIGWSEYWPFLGTFINIASSSGLSRLETYLEERFLSNTDNSKSTVANLNKSKLSNNDNEINLIGQLCQAFEACTLRDKSPSENKFCLSLKNVSSPQTQPSSGFEPERVNLNPLLYVERTIKVLATRLSDGLIQTLGQTTTHAVPDLLKQEVKHLETLVQSYRSDKRFESIDFRLIHARLARAVAEQLDLPERLQLFDDACRSLGTAAGEVSSDDELGPEQETPYRLAGRPRVARLIQQRLRQHARCLASQLRRALAEQNDASPDNDDPWSSAEPCLCLWDAPRISYRRKPSRPETCRVLLFDNSTSSLNDCHSSDEDIFTTPPSSPMPNRREQVTNKREIDCDSSTSEDEWHETTDYKRLYIEGDQPTRTDVNVIQALEGCNITPQCYPNIHRWKHLVLLHPVEERARWPNVIRRSPTSQRTPQRAHQLLASLSPYSPTQPPYTPLSPGL